MAATKFKGIIKREVKIFQVEEPVVLRLTETGIEASVAGMRTKLEASWETIVRAMQTPGNVPSYLAGKPVEFLKYQAKQKAK